MMLRRYTVLKDSGANGTLICHHRCMLSFPERVCKTPMCRKRFPGFELHGASGAINERFVADVFRGTVVLVLGLVLRIEEMLCVFFPHSEHQKGARNTEGSMAKNSSLMSGFSNSCLTLPVCHNSKRVSAADTVHSSATSVMNMLAKGLASMSRSPEGVMVVGICLSVSNL